MKASHQSSYTGVYQAYAWQQGYNNAPTTFRIPDEHFLLNPHDDPFLWEEGFKLADFMEAVAHIDNEGYIHYWKYHEADGDRYLTLACTEDASSWMPTEHSEFYHAADDYWKEV